MTALEIHTGRPDIAPWLRGWFEEDWQTTVVWRSHLPVREGVAEWPRPRTSTEKREVEDFFEAAPPHQSEKLETETYRVASWLQARANALLKRKRDASQESAEGEDAAEGEASTADAPDAEEPETEQTTQQGN
jgi:CRISPR-associated endonuclease/helicase Cas3